MLSRPTRLFIRDLLRNRTARLLAALFLVFTLPLTITVLNQQQNIQPHAQSTGPLPTVSLSTTTVAPGGNITITANQGGGSTGTLRRRLYVYSGTSPVENDPVSQSYGSITCNADKFFYVTEFTSSTYTLTAPSALCQNYKVVINAESGQDAMGVASGCSWNDKAYKKYYGSCTTAEPTKCNGYVEFTGQSCSNDTPKSFKVESGSTAQGSYQGGYQSGYQSGYQGSYSGASNNYLPKGYLDVATCTTLEGWTCDQDKFSKSLSVHVYKDGGSGAGTYITQTVASQIRTDVSSQCGGTTAHGFSISTPNSFKDGNAHTVYVHAINVDSNGDPVANVTNPVLTNSPKTITCSGVGGPGTTVVPSVSGLNITSGYVPPGGQVTLTASGANAAVYKLYIHDSGSLNTTDPVSQSYNPSSLSPDTFHYLGNSPKTITLPNTAGTYKFVVNAESAADLTGKVTGCNWNDQVYTRSSSGAVTFTGETCSNNSIKTYVLSNPTTTTQYTAWGVVYNDVDGDGQRDTSEAGVSNIKINAIGVASGMFAGSDTTDSGGNYGITLNAGSYDIRLAVLPTGWSLTTPGSAIVTLGSGNPTALVAFGIRNTTSTVSPSPSPNTSPSPGTGGPTISVSSIDVTPETVPAGASGNISIDVNGQATIFNVYLYGGPMPPDRNVTNPSVQLTYDRNNVQQGTFYRIGYAYMDRALSILPPSQKGAYYIVANAEASNGTNSTKGCDWRGQEYTRNTAPGGSGAVTFTNNICGNSGPKFFQVTEGSYGQCSNPQVPNDSLCDQNCDCQSGFCAWGGTNGICKAPTSNTTSLALDIVADGVTVAASGVQEQVIVQVLSPTGSVIKEATGTVMYNGNTQTYQGTINLGNVSSGDYYITAKLVNSLSTQVSADLISVTAQSVNVLPTTSVSLGDANNDDKLDIFDFNILYDCLSDLTSCTGELKDTADFNGNGSVDLFDYNIFYTNASQRQN